VSSTPRIVLVGYGPVGARFVEDLLPAVRLGAVALTVVGAEDEEAYNRVLVAEFAVGRTDRSAMEVTDTAAAVEAGVRFVRGAHVTGIDRDTRTVTLDDESVLGYDRLVLATGARANVSTPSPATCGHCCASTTPSRVATSGCPTA
jgi:assimilatory nitrate reductase electron transfer subunit